VSTDTERARRAWRDAERSVFWLASADAPPACPPLQGRAEADLAIVGGGFTGLWAALQAKEDDPDREVVLLEGETVAFGGSGRNGGFCMRTLTHGLPNGLRRFPEELAAIEGEAAASFEGIRDTIRRYAIDCDWTESGELAVAREAHEVPWAREQAAQLRAFGYDAVFLDREEVRAEVASRTYLAGAWDRSGCVMVDPARLAWGLRRAALELGVRIHERTPVTSLAREGAGLRLATPRATLRARRAIVGTNAFPPLLREIRRYVVPVYDHVLVTEPLSDAQWASIGWERRQGLADMANRFHYYRRTADGRILWGGFDAVYHWRGKVDPAFEDRPRTFDALSAHFFQTFPQLEGLRFSHRWAGVIDTCSRFSVFFGRAFDGALAYAAGYTGMGVGATRFGARVALDLVDGLDPPRTRLGLVRTKPVPFPPEPLRSAGIAVTVRALARADRRQGRPGPWLRLLDAAGLGFDS
jgi:glycine/D-amino acid oxidase-like deaminating enzyme